MAFEAVKRLRGKLAADEATYGMFVGLDAAAVTEIAVDGGLDWVIVDAEHGQLDWGGIAGHLRCTARSGTVGLVRLAEFQAGMVKRALDLGADGIVIPGVESAQELQRIVAAALYPPAGIRGIGAERATAWGRRMQEYVAQANDNVLVVPIIESVAGGRNIAEILEVPGVDLFYLGPADYSSTAGHPGAWEGPGVAETMLAIKDKIRRRGKHVGIVGTDADDLARRREQGFQLLGVGLDATLLWKAIDRMLPAAGTIGRPLPRPEERFRPDRPEVMAALADAPTVELGPGATFRCQVGAHNRARGLTTGIVEIACGGEVPCHTHTFSESITLLSGKAEVEVEGRIYSLAPLDTVTIRAGLAHAARNVDPRTPAILHVALAHETPGREMCDPRTPAIRMPDDSTGVPGGEHVVRFAAARRYAPGPATEFVDCCNASLVPGVEMSGGYGRFTRGGRLPAHVHDFDESICITSGTAICVVEGRNHELSGSATALQPRGRVHYFRNDREEPMTMIWFYAGPQPERIVVDERCATPAGDPWQTITAGSAGGGR